MKLQTHRRGWHTERCATGKHDWWVPQLAELYDLPRAMEAMYQDGHDVGLLTKADAWYAANVEEQP
jgi:hypothetical protein